VGALRGDGVAPSTLGLAKLIGDDSLRRALGAITPAPDQKHTAEQRAAQQIQLARSVQWMQDQLEHSIAQATATPWILGCDTTIKPLYGKQDGAVVSYNPHKLGRPSHAIQIARQRRQFPQPERCGRGRADHPYRAHPGWTARLHLDNLGVACPPSQARDSHQARGLATYSTVRRFLLAHCMHCQARARHVDGRATEATVAARDRLKRLEVRIFEVEHVGTLWRLGGCRT